MNRATARKIELRIAHHHPGRLRLRSDIFCGDEVESVSSALRPIAGVQSVVLNRHTGSVLVAYEPSRIAPDAIVETAVRVGNLHLASRQTTTRREDEIAKAVVDAVKELNAMVGEMTGHCADLRTLVPAALATAGFFSLAIGKYRLPRWDNLLYWSYSVFIASNRFVARDRQVDRGG